MDMTPGRSRAYGRVMRALKSRSALDRMSSEQRETLREAADTLVLARSTDDESLAALAAARSVLMSIRRDEASPGSSSSPTTWKTPVRRRSSS